MKYELAAELDWREAPHACIEQIFALRSIPTELAPPELDDDVARSWR